MPGANINPDDVEKFAVQLAKVTDQAAQQMRHLQMLLHQLPDSWQDEHFTKFEGDMNAALADFDRFRIKVEDFIPWLGKKVVLARAYLDG